MDPFDQGAASGLGMDAASHFFESGETGWPAAAPPPAGVAPPAQTAGEEEQQHAELQPFEASGASSYYDIPEPHEQDPAAVHGGGLEQQEQQHVQGDVSSAYYWHQQQQQQQQQQQGGGTMPLPLPPPPPPVAPQYHQQHEAGSGDDALARLRGRALVGRHSTEEDVLLLLEEVERLKVELDAERHARERAERAAGEATAMWERAKRAVEQCSEDARRAVAELEESQVLQQELQESLSAALQRLEQLQGEGEETSMFLDEPPQALGLHEQRALRSAQGRAKTLVNALELLQARCGYYPIELTGRNALRLAFTLWRLHPQTAGSAGRDVAAAAEGAIGADGMRRMVGGCIEVVEDLLSSSHPPLSAHQHARSRAALLLARSSGDSVASAGSVASASLVEAGRARVLRTEVAILKAKLQAMRDAHGTALQMLNAYESRFQSERGLDFAASGSSAYAWGMMADDHGWAAPGRGGVGAAAGSGGGGGSRSAPPYHHSHYLEEEMEDDSFTVFSTSIGSQAGMGMTGGGGLLIRRLEHFCRTVNACLQERDALNQQLEQALSDCVCSKFAT